MGDREPPLVCGRPPGWVGPRDPAAFERIAEWARTAEQRGLDGLFLGDRMLDHVSGTGGRDVYGASMLDVTTTLAALAGQTERLLLGPLVLVVPYRHPLQLAKSIGTLDLISGGRVVLGAGIGWNRTEFDALGVEMKGRGDRFEATLEVARALWRGEVVTEQTPWWTLEDAAVSPLPAQDGGPPVWLASFSPDGNMDWGDEFPPLVRKVLDRVGRIADGWVPMVYSAAAMLRLEPDVLARAWDQVLASADRAGRSRVDIDFVHSDWIYVLDGEGAEERCREALGRFFAGDFEDAKRTYVIGTADEVVEQLRATTAGIDRVDRYILTPLSDEIDQVELLASEVAAPLREGALTPPA